jgi:hypothetical protein
MNFNSKFKIIIAIFVAIFCSIVIFSACSWTSGTQEITFPKANVSFMHSVQPFLAFNCSYSPCHSNFDLAGGYTMTEYHYIIQIPGFIVQGNPAGSRFVQILENEATHPTYFYRGNIKSEHIEGVKTWIKEGGINN